MWIAFQRSKDPIALTHFHLNRTLDKARHISFASESKKYTKKLEYELIIDENDDSSRPLHLPQNRPNDQHDWLRRGPFGLDETEE